MRTRGRARHPNFLTSILQSRGRTRRLLLRSANDQETGMYVYLRVSTVVERPSSTGDGARITQRNCNRLNCPQAHGRLASIQKITPRTASPAKIPSLQCPSSPSQSTRTSCTHYVRIPVLSAILFFFMAFSTRASLITVQAPSCVARFVSFRHTRGAAPLRRDI